jgi:uncharacterized protein (TIGR00288 family)
MEQSRARVALLIDGDNSVSTLIAALLAEAGTFGDVIIRRVYGNWSLPSMHAWQGIAPHYGLEQRHHGQTATGKNATDIALVVDAMDLLYSGAIDHFCLVTSDSDYTPLVMRLRSAGCKVFGIGKPTTPLALKTACTEFVSTDQLLSERTQPLPIAQPTATQPPVIAAPVPTSPPTEPSLPSGPLTLLVNAYDEVAKKEAIEWVLLSSIGTILKQRDVPFSPAVYGHKDLLTFVKAYPDQFETCRQASKGKPVLVRRKYPPVPGQPILPPSSGKATTSPTPSARKKAVPPSSLAQTATPTPGKIQPLRDGPLTALLITAYTQAAEKVKANWVSIPHLGAALKGLDPQFKAQVYGYKDLPSLVQRCPGLFLTRKQTTGKTKHLEVLLVTGKEGSA